MSEDHRKPGVQLWATVALAVVLAGYPLSFGPSCWVTSRLNAGELLVSTVYRPMTLALSREPGAGSRINSIIQWYARLGAAGGWEWVLFSESPLTSPDEAEWRWGPVPIF
jgi:hypothetical protein